MTTDAPGYRLALQSIDASTEALGIAVEALNARLGELATILGPVLREHPEFDVAEADDTAPPVAAPGAAIDTELAAAVAQRNPPLAAMTSTIRDTAQRIADLSARVDL